MTHDRPLDPRAARAGDGPRGEHVAVAGLRPPRPGAAHVPPAAGDGPHDRVAHLLDARARHRLPRPRRVQRGGRGRRGRGARGAHPLGARPGGPTMGAGGVFDFGVADIHRVLHRAPARRSRSTPTPRCRASWAPTSPVRRGAAAPCRPGGRGAAGGRVRRGRLGPAGPGGDPVLDQGPAGQRRMSLPSSGSSPPSGVVPVPVQRAASRSPSAIGPTSTRNVSSENIPRVSRIRSTSAARPCTSCSGQWPTKSSATISSATARSPCHSSRSQRS